MNFLDEASLSAAANFISVILAILDQRLIASMRSLYSKTVRATHPYSALHELRFSSSSLVRSNIPIGLPMSIFSMTLQHSEHLLQLFKMHNQLVD